MYHNAYTLLNIIFYFLTPIPLLVASKVSEEGGLAIDLAGNVSRYKNRKHYYAFKHSSPLVLSSQALLCLLYWPIVILFRQESIKFESRSNHILVGCNMAHAWQQRRYVCNNHRRLPISSRRLRIRLLVIFVLKLFFSMEIFVTFKLHF